MSDSRRLFLLGTLLVLGSTRARAQSQPAAPPAAPPQQVLTLRVTMPTVVGYAMRLLAKDRPAPRPGGRSAPRTSNPVLVLTVPLPTFLSPAKTPAPK